MINQKKYLVFLSFLLTISLGIVAPVWAQEEATTSSQESLVTDDDQLTISPTPQPTPTPATSSMANLISVSPPVRELELPRGSANSYQISLTNQGEETITLVLRASSFTASGDAGGVDVADDPLNDSQNWVVINPSIVTLDSGEQADITYTVAIPTDAEPGGFYFAITALLSGDTSVTGQTSQITTGSAVNLNVASLNLVSIEGDVNYAAQVSEFSTPKVLSEYGPVPLTAKIANFSSVHIKPILEVEVRNTWGLEETSLIHLEEQNILPQAQRKYETEFGGKWHFGRYAATLNGLYGDGQNLTYTIFFWILPWKVIVAIILAIVILVLLIVFIKRQLNEKKILEEELNKIKGNQ